MSQFTRFIKHEYFALGFEQRRCLSCLAGFVSNVTARSSAANNIAAASSANYLHANVGQNVRAIRQRLESIRNFTASSTLWKGHSKWQNIKDTKAKKDDERSRRMSFYFNQLRSALRDGVDPKFNKKLVDLERDYIKESLPLDTFNRMLQRFKEKPEVVSVFQLIGPNNTYFIVRMEAETKTKMQNAMLKVLKKLPEFQITDRLIGPEFEEKGVITVDSIIKQSKSMTLEQVEEIAIELECEEVRSAGSDERSEKFELICDTLQLTMIEGKLDAMGFEVLSAEAQMLPLNERVCVGNADAAKVEKFFELVGDIEFVKQISDNLVQEDSDNSSTEESYSNNKAGSAN